MTWYPILLAYDNVKQVSSDVVVVPSINVVTMSKQVRPSLLKSIECLIVVVFDDP